VRLETNAEGEHELPILLDPSIASSPKREKDPLEVRDFSAGKTTEGKTDT